MRQNQNLFNPVPRKITSKIMLINRFKTVFILAVVAQSCIRLITFRTNDRVKCILQIEKALLKWTNIHFETVVK